MTRLVQRKPTAPILEMHSIPSQVVSLLDRLGEIVLAARYVGLEVGRQTHCQSPIAEAWQAVQPHLRRLIDLLDKVDLIDPMPEELLPAMRALDKVDRMARSLRAAQESKTPSIALLANLHERSFSNASRRLDNAISSARIVLRNKRDWSIAAPPVMSKVRPKRSTECGEGRAKLIAALTKHHEYAEGGCLNLDPIGNNELARRAGVDKSTASAFFSKEFKGHGKYKVTCVDGRLAAALKLLNGEFAPFHLYGAKPPGEAGRDDE